MTCDTSLPLPVARRRVVVGEVEPGVDAELGPGPAVVGAGGLQFRGEQADGDHSAVDANRCFPLAEDFLVGDTFEARAMAVGAGVVSVLQLGTDPQVMPAVVHAVAVDVIDNHPGRRVHNLAVHPDASASGSVVPAYVELAAATADAPLVLPESPEVPRFQHAELVLGQGDKADVVASGQPARATTGAFTAGTEVAARSVGRHAGQLAQSAGAVDADEQDPPAVSHPAGVGTVTTIPVLPSPARDWTSCTAHPMFRACLQVLFFLVQSSIVDRESSIQRAASDLAVPLSLDGCSRLCRKIPVRRAPATAVSRERDRNKRICARGRFCFSDGAHLVLFLPEEEDGTS